VIIVLPCHKKLLSHAHLLNFFLKKVYNWLWNSLFYSLYCYYVPLCLTKYINKALEAARKRLICFLQTSGRLTLHSRLVLFTRWLDFDHWSAQLSRCLAHMCVGHFPMQRPQSLNRPALDFAIQMKCLYMCLSVCLSVCVSVCLSVSLCVCTCVCLSFWKAGFSFFLPPQDVWFPFTRMHKE